MIFRHDSFIFTCDSHDYFSLTVFTCRYNLCLYLSHSRNVMFIWVHVQFLFDQLVWNTFARFSHELMYTFLTNKVEWMDQYVLNVADTDFPLLHINVSSRTFIFCIKSLRRFYPKWCKVTRSWSLNSQKRNSYIF